MLIDIVHTTRFSYDAPIVESVMETHLEPRNDAFQRRLFHQLEVRPATRVQRYQDGFGNGVSCFTVLQPHAELIVTASSRVETLLANPFEPPGRPEPPLDPVEAWPFLQFGGPVLDLPEVRALAARCGPTPREAPIEWLQQVMGIIHDTFTYESEVTTVRSTVADLLALERGVCQDFAHLMIALCRIHAVPARYASGYIFTDSAHAARGGGASHAWCEAYVPGFGWRGFDPTNGVLAAESHVKVGQGRSYQDVPPTRGIYRGLAEERVDVRVSTTAAESATT